MEKPDPFNPENDGKIDGESGTGNMLMEEGPDKNNGKVSCVYDRWD